MNEKPYELAAPARWHMRHKAADITCPPPYGYFDEALTDRSQTSRASVDQPFLRLMTSAVPLSDSRALTPYSATPASKVLGEEMGCSSGMV